MKQLKVLLVSTHPTHPTNAGNRAAMMSQVQMLEKIGCKVYFLYAETSLKSNKYRDEMVKHWGDRLLYYNEPLISKVYRRVIDKYRVTFNNSYWKCDDHYVSGLASYINKLNETMCFDACIVQYMRLSKLLPNISIPRKCIFTHDVFSYKDIRVDSKFYETVNAHQEAVAMQRCPNIFAIQDNEAIYYQFLSPKSKVYTVYNPYNVVCQAIKNNSTLLFIASQMDFNVNGINRFLDNYWDKIHSRFPNLKLKIGGTVCKKILKEYPNVVKLGLIDNLDDFYAEGDIVINPVYQGTGLKIKTFEALAYGKLVLCHPHSALGIFNKKDAPIFISDNVDEWCDFLSKIFEDENMLLQYKDNAHNYITEMNCYIEQQYRDFIYKPLI